jgi:hypothetical protein
MSLIAGLDPIQASSAEPRSILPGQKVTKKAAYRVVKRFGDYSPTAAAFKGDLCLQRGDMARQWFWLQVTLWSSEILFFRD